MIEKLRLYQFRNFQDQLIEFSPVANIFIGLNGQGKSNILESIHYLFLGESFRPATSEHLILEGENQCSIQALIKNAESSHRINLKIQQGKRLVEVDGKALSPRLLAEIETPILFSPESLNSIKGSSEERRKLIDQMLVSLNPKNNLVLAEFKKLLRTRNKVLKDRLKNLITDRQATDLLEALNPRFLSSAILLTTRRIETLRDLMPWMNSAMNDLSAGFPEIRVRYLISEQDFALKTVDHVTDVLQKKLALMQKNEWATGLSLVGPHKHDIQFLFGGNDSRFFCSQGQQRCLILAFKLAQIVYHRKVFKKSPLLLLDDVLSELDGEKRSSFLRLVEKLEAQVVITTTDFDLTSEIFNPSQTRVHRVSNGSLDLKGS